MRVCDDCNIAFNEIKCPLCEAKEEIEELKYEIYKAKILGVNEDTFIVIPKGGK